MSLETGSVVNDLTPTNPSSSDPVGQGDDHLRLIKACLLGTFPQMGTQLGKVTKQDVAASISATWNTNHFVCSASATTTVVLSLPASASITSGFYVDITTVNTGRATVIPNGADLLNGLTSYAVLAESSARVYYQGAGVFRGEQSPTGGGGNNFAGNLLVAGNIQGLGTLTISGATTLGNNLTVNGNATMLGGLTISGSVVCGNSLIVNGNTTLGGTLSVSGATVLAAAGVNGTFSVSGNTVLSGALTAGGAMSALSTLSVSGAATLNTTLNVQGATTLSGAVVLNSTLIVKGSATFSAGVVINGAVSISGATTLTGLLNTTNGQIQFPAVQNPSANANTLDDYEEGTWTPGLTYTTPGTLSVAYNTQSGEYTKVGRKVHAVMGLVTNTHNLGTATGNLLVSGLPFGPNVGPGQTPGKCAWQGITKASYTEVDWTVLNGATDTQFIASGSGQTRSNIQVGNTATGTQITLYGNVTYHI